MRTPRALGALAVGLTLVLAGAPLHGQSLPRPGSRAPGQAPVRRPPADPGRPAGDLVSATQALKASLERVLAIDEQNVRALSAALEQQNELYRQGHIGDAELAQSQRELAEAKADVEETRAMLRSAQTVLTEVAAASQLARLPALRPGELFSGPALIRYNGTTPWTLAGAPPIESFFLSRFGRPLPVSARGQTPVHDRLAFDHRQAMDVAVHPDSAEGQALMAYLKGGGIPFLAFRQPVHGEATGAHIHIGQPSARTR
jgi:hypothetical protein